MQGRKRLLEQSNRDDPGFNLDDGPVDGNALANKSKLALVVQDAGDLVEARLLHEEVCARARVCACAHVSLPIAKPDPPCSWAGRLMMETVCVCLELLG